MKSWLQKIGFFLILLIAGGILYTVAGELQDSRIAVVLDVEGAIGPATSDYIERGLENAVEQGAELVVLRMDTPGGLDTSMRGIIKQITTSTIPVVGYVAPSGARAASAGTYILYASHVAAMAPGTNLGAATPIKIGGLPGQGDTDDDATKDDNDKDKDNKGSSSGKISDKKLINDAAAYLRSLAQMRGRNMEWAEKAVRESVSLPAKDALRIGVIDLIATDLQDLLGQLQGRTVNVRGGEKTLRTDGLTVVQVEPDWRNRLLAVISNPNVAYVLMLLGIYGLVYEFSNPGAILPGTVGAISLVLALFAFQALPINYAGVALILFGLALMVAEAFVPSFGALGIGGVVAFVIGSVILFDAEAPGYGVALPLIISFTLVSTVLLIAVVGMAVRARTRPVVSGSEQLLGAEGRAIGAFDRDGMVRLHGEVWQARTDKILKEDQLVRVTGRNGLILLVTPVHASED